MTLQEFKAWFEGFTEDMGGAPNKKQWERVKARVKEIDGATVTREYFADRYWPPYRWHWETFTTCGSLQGVAASEWQGMAHAQGAGNLNTRNDGHAVFNSSQAMLALGKADYQSIGR